MLGRFVDQKSFNGVDGCLLIDAVALFAGFRRHQRGGRCQLHGQTLVDARLHRLAKHFAAKVARDGKVLAAFVEHGPRHACFTALKFFALGPCGQHVDKRNPYPQLLQQLDRNKVRRGQEGVRNNGLAVLAQHGHFRIGPNRLFKNVFRFDSLGIGFQKCMQRLHGRRRRLVFNFDFNVVHGSELCEKKNYNHVPHGKIICIGIFVLIATSSFVKKIPATDTLPFASAPEKYEIR